MALNHIYDELDKDRSPDKFVYGVIQNQQTSLYQVWYKFGNTKLSSEKSDIYFLTAHANPKDAYDTMHKLTLIDQNSKPIKCHEDLLKIADSFPSDETPSPVSENELQALRDFIV
jgi:hypothetical protein